MPTVHINVPELLSIALFRIALSEATQELREKAITNVRHEVVALRLEAISKALGTDWMSHRADAEFATWIAQTSIVRHEAICEFQQTARRYEERNERKLNVAEQIGKLIWLSIQDKTFEGVQTSEGILKQVREQALAHGISGAKDLDTLRQIWKDYRGVVHLGMAMDFCEDHPERGQNVLLLAESYRRDLSQSCPRGTRVPYVSEDIQIYFLYISRTSGPRFRDRGLPFNIV